MAYTTDLKSVTERYEGSSPSTGSMTTGNMNKYTIYDLSSGKGYPGAIKEYQDKLFIYMPPVPSRAAFQSILSDIKGMEGAQWLPEEVGKPWSVKHPRVSRRNRNVLGMLTVGKFPGTPDKPFQEQNVFQLTDEIKNKYPLKDYQIEDIQRALRWMKFELGWDMGLGKTLAAIVVMEIVKYPRPWVIGSLSALKAWESELRKWKPSISPVLISNSPQGIKRAMDEHPAPPQVLINDEAANLKNAKTQRVQLLFELTRLMEETYEHPVIVNMTGTPQPKNPADWWSQIELLHPGWIREKSAGDLTKRLAHMTEVNAAHGTYSQVSGWKTEEIERFYQRLKPIVSIRLKKDCLSLPEKIYIDQQLPISPEMAAAEKIIAETSETALKALSITRQLSDGFQYIHEYQDTRRVRVGSYNVTTPKDAALLEHLEELAENEQTRVVIWAAYQEAIDKICRLCQSAGWATIRVDGRGWEGTNCEASQDQFQLRDWDKRIAFVANPDSGGEGLTLTRASTAIYYSLTFRADKYQQSQDRIHRIGMDENRSPRIIHLLHLSSDKLILENLRKKKNLQDLSTGQMIDELTRFKLETNT